MSRDPVVLRDVLIHGYSGIDAEAIWDIVSTKLATVEAELRRVLRDGGPAPPR